MKFDNCNFDRKITLLTKPIKRQKNLNPMSLLRLVRFFYHFFKKKPVGKISKYGGHPAVTRSLVVGLRSLKLNFNIDPSSEKEIGRICHVLSDVEALKEAIALKQLRKIDYLIAGPNLVVLPSDEAETIGSKYLDLYLINSEWTKLMYQKDLPALKGRCEIWPAGVDINFWKPSKKCADKKLIKALFYIKTNKYNSLIQLCKQSLIDYGIDVCEIRYGDYQLDQYRANLEDSLFSVFFSEVESQGIALAESWAMDVPTLVFNLNSFETTRGGKIKRWESSSAPYLTKDTGYFFTDHNTFLESYSVLIKNIEFMSPRLWIEKNLSDIEAAKIYIKCVQEIAKIDTN